MQEVGILRFKWFDFLSGIIYCGWNVLLCFCLVPTNLRNVAKTQFVLLNHSSSLWCPAEGGPAPRIVWRKNGAVVQNSTSVRLQINVTEEEGNTNYSCEVDDQEPKNISLVVESKSQVTSLLQGISVFVYAFGKPYSLSWVNLRIFGFRMKPSTILFKGNMKSHIYDIKHKITKGAFHWENPDLDIWFVAFHSSKSIFRSVIYQIHSGKGFIRSVIYVI